MNIQQQREFGEREFGIQPLTGMRTFRVTTTGTLTGAVSDIPWHCGQNIAECRPPFEVSYHPAGEPIASLKCTCGFYAYFDASFGDQYYDDPTHPMVNAHWLFGKGPDYNILGLIEGFGLLTVGERGFRAGRARLRCLIEPPIEDEAVPYLRPFVTELRQRFGKTRAAYPVPVVPTVDAALAEWPLTPVVAS